MIERVFLATQMVKNPSEMRKTWVRSLGWEDSLEEIWEPTPVFFLEESHGQRSLAGYSPWGCTKSDTTEQLNTTTDSNAFSDNCSGLGQGR